MCVDINTLIEPAEHQLFYLSKEIKVASRTTIFRVTKV